MSSSTVPPYISFALFVVSLALIGASLSMEPFHLAADGSYPMFSVPEGDSQAYFIAREQALTGKFALQDYGVTMLVFSLVLAAFNWQPFKAPRSLPSFLGVAVAAPFVTVGAFAFDLIQGQGRWEFPPWADSLGIPLMGIPILLVAGLVWAFSHFVLLAGVPRRAGVYFSLVVIRRSHLWLRVIFTLTALLVVGASAQGRWWYVVAGAFWLYFYASIAAVRHE